MLPQRIDEDRKYPMDVHSCAAKSENIGIAATENISTLYPVLYPNLVIVAKEDVTCDLDLNSSCSFVAIVDVCICAVSTDLTNRGARRGTIMWLFENIRGVLILATGLLTLY